MEKKRYTAAELAQMRLPGLPATKANVIGRAEREGWPYEEVKGVGGTRRLYEVPQKYFPSTPEGASPACTASENVAGTVVGGSSSVDLDKLELAMRALSEWEAERGVRVSEARRPAVVAVLYDHLQRVEKESDGGRGLERLLRALG